MYRLLIVDDEPDVVEGLYNFFYHYEALELDVFKAYSGPEVLDILNEERIDIVISDICMPGMTGLELIREVKKNWPYCQVIFLSGHTEFSYIYEAGQLEAVTYILKTEGYERIAEGIYKAVKNIENTIKLTSVNTGGLEFKHQFISSLLVEDTGSKEDLAQVFKNLNIDFHSDNPIYIMLGYVRDQDKLNLKEKSRMYAALNEIARAHLLPYFNVLIDECEEKTDLFLLQPHRIGGDNRHYEVYIRGAAEAIQSAFMDRLGLCLSFVIHSLPLAFQEISRCYRKLKTILYERKKLSEGMMLVTSDSEAERDEKVYLQLSGETQEIALIKDYIRRHLGDTLSLTMLAKMVYLNPSYLSRIFKLHTGVTIVGYITAARIERAKELLVSTNMKINSIAAGLGFDSASYFNQTFRRYVKVSPIEYRLRKGEKL